MLTKRTTAFENEHFHSQSWEIFILIDIHKILVILVGVTVDSRRGVLISVTEPCPGALDTGSWLAVHGIGMKILTPW
jgi:hypothetical protein